MWLLYHAHALCYEFEYRFDKKHFTACFIKWATNNMPVHLSTKPQTPFVQAIANQSLHRADPVEAYRLYYNVEKSKFAKWTKRKPPFWYLGRETIFCH